MIQMIRCAKEPTDKDWVYMIYIYAGGRSFYKRTTRIDPIKPLLSFLTLEFTQENRRYIEDEWMYNLIDDGFGEYCYYDPFKRHRKRGPRGPYNITKPRAGKDNNGFKKSLIKRKSKDAT